MLKISLLKISLIKFKLMKLKKLMKFYHFYLKIITILMNLQYKVKYLNLKYLLSLR